MTQHPYDAAPLLTIYRCLN